MLISTTITDALIELAVINPSEEATPQDHAFGLRTLNRIVDTYNAQNLTVTYLEDIAYGPPGYNPNAPDCVITSSDGSILTLDGCDIGIIDASTGTWSNTVTIGLGMNIDEEAPISIEAAFFRLNDIDHKMMPMSMNQWADIQYKNITAIPSRYYIQKMEGNKIKIYFDVIPQKGLILHLIAKRPYTGKNSVGRDYSPTDDIDWTYGFEKMLMSRLAIEMAPSYEINVSPVLLGKAQEAEGIVKAYNYTPLTLKADRYLQRGGARSRSSRTNRARY